MVDHRGTPSQRAYQLPGWFFVLTVTVSVLALGAVGWIFLGDRFESSPRGPEAATSPAVSASEPTTAPPTVDPTPRPSPKAERGGQDERPDIEVVVLNASEKPGLAATVAKVAENAGWTVGEVGDWIYPAVVNAVYYPEGHQREAELLADDVAIDSVRPARPGMSTDRLTVLLVYSP